MIVQEYIREDGSNPFGSWFSCLDSQAAAKVATATLRLEMGNTSNVKWIGGGLGEYRIDWGPGYRLYLAQDGDALIILFVGGTKKRQQADIDRAGALLAEYKARKATVKPSGRR
jgi:putative addiction module killer protein